MLIIIWFACLLHANIKKFILLSYRPVYEKIGHKKLFEECIKLKEGEILQNINFNVCLSTIYDFLTLYIAEFQLN
jgi:hypothetical protein